MKPLVTLSLVAVAIPGIAAAHAHMTGSDPAKGAAVKAPSAIHVTFSEAVNPAFTGIALTDAAGHAALLGKPGFDAPKTTLAASVTGPLKPGAYTVKWHAVAADTHRSAGSFTFTVTP
jgi:copper resistance protein C